jgi:hypothetical protein
VTRRIEGLAEGFTSTRPSASEDAAELADGHAEALGDGASVGLRGGGLQAERERIERGEEILEQAGRRELAQLLALALMAALLVLLGPRCCGARCP